MNFSRKSLIVSLVLLLAVSCAVFAQSITEKVKEPSVRFNALELETESISDIMETYAIEVTYYEKQYQYLYDAMVQAYEKNKAEDFYNARSELYALSVPSISKSQTETLIARVLGCTDESEKSEFAAWLYKNSRYYRPSLSFSMQSSYKGNGRNSYSSSSYSISVQPGSAVTLPSVSAKVSNDGVFVGWGLTPDEVLYEAGQEIAMPYSSQTLYAIYKPGLQFTDSVTGYDAVVDLESSMVPVLEAPDSTYVFLGWYDSNTGKALDEESLGKDGRSACYFAKWKSLSVSELCTKYYDNFTIPANEQVSLTFSLENCGNVASGALTVELVPENAESLKVLNAKLSSSSISAGSARNGSYTVVAKGASGEIVNATIVITDSSGCVWETPVTLTIK